MLVRRKKSPPPCDCIAYPFPHREGGGACTGENPCPECKHPTRVLRYDWEQGETMIGCTNCNWRD